MNNRDWNCKCGKSNWARRHKCFECGIPKPQSQMNGDWVCNNCNELQFARRTSCYKCKSLKPSPTVPIPEGDECIICLENKRDCLMVHGDTGHNVTCIGCAQKVTNCPICRQAIDSRVKMFN